MVFTKSLKGQYRFKLTLKRGQYFSNKNITIYVLKNKKCDSSNFLGICVSKKHGNSVVRNRLKRWVREAYKEIEDSVEVGNNIIVLFKKNINVDEIDFHLVKKELIEAIEKVGMNK